MSVTFEPVLDNFGFDASASPDWIMVPARDSMPIWLVNGAGSTVRTRSPGVASVAFEGKPAPGVPTRQIIRIHGHAVGRTLVEVLQHGRVVKLLEVAVKPPVTLKISFHFVSDSASPPHTTRRTPSELHSMMMTLNGIYTPQTNIRFVMKSERALKMPGNLGDAVNFNKDNQGRDLRGNEWDAVVARRDNGAHINVFFVWRNEFRIQNASGRIEVSGALGYVIGDGRDVLLQDWDGRQDRDADGVDDSSPDWENARALAHEIGHVLGIADVTKTRPARRGMPSDRWASPAVRGRVNANDRYVMGSGPFIPKAHANIMSAIASQIAGR